MTRKAILIWKAAMSNLNPAPPPCPSDFAEPVWANLVFGGAQCEVCHAPNISKRLLSVFAWVHRTATRPMCTKSRSSFVEGCAPTASRKSQSQKDVPINAPFLTTFSFSFCKGLSTLASFQSFSQNTKRKSWISFHTRTVIDLIRSLEHPNRSPLSQLGDGRTVTNQKVNSSGETTSTTWRTRLLPTREMCKCVNRVPNAHWRVSK
jgi:hypothetical protein